MVEQERGSSFAEEREVPIRGFLIHITHYDPRWCKFKSEEKPFDLEVGLEIVKEISRVGMNLLVIDCADGVEYKSHPELARKYTIPMDYVERLVNKAREEGIEVVPKLNFSQSAYHKHNHWFRPHNALFDNHEYWRIAFEIIDELIQICRPTRYFHIGMDEDHDRAYSQYIEAIITLHEGLKERELRPMVWNDSACKLREQQIFVEKSLAAEKKIPRDIVQIVWDYTDVQPEIIRRLSERGFEVWAAPGREDSRQVLGWKQAVLDHGGEGLLMTTWLPSNRSTLPKILHLIRRFGPIYTRS